MQALAADREWYAGGFLGGVGKWVSASYMEGCCVCLETFEGHIRCQTPCGHFLCAHCLYKIRKAECPLCRASLDGQLPQECVSSILRDHGRTSPVVFSLSIHPIRGEVRRNAIVNVDGGLPLALARALREVSGSEETTEAVADADGAEAGADADGAESGNVLSNYA